jgi:hypothetical protein
MGTQKMRGNIHAFGSEAGKTSMAYRTGIMNRMLFVKEANKQVEDVFCYIGKLFDAALTNRDPELVITISRSLNEASLSIEAHLG